VDARYREPVTAIINYSSTFTLAFMLRACHANAYWNSILLVGACTGAPDLRLRCFSRDVIDGTSLSDIPPPFVSDAFSSPVLHSARQPGSPCLCGPQRDPDSKSRGIIKRPLHLFISLWFLWIWKAFYGTFIIRGICENFSVIRTISLRLSITLISIFIIHLVSCSMSDWVSITLCAK